MRTTDPIDPPRPANRTPVAAVDDTSTPGAEPTRPERLAWQLADHLKNAAPGSPTPTIYIQLGRRHYRRAIKEALELAGREGVTLPASLTAALRTWLDAYRGHADQAFISNLLDRARNNRSHH